MRAAQDECADALKARPVCAVLSLGGRCAMSMSAVHPCRTRRPPKSEALDFIDLGGPSRLHARTMGPKQLARVTPTGRSLLAARFSARPVCGPGLWIGRALGWLEA